jgi:hypothetical protein
MGIVVGGRRAVVPLVGIIVPLLFLYASGATDPAFLKFLLVSAPFLCLLLGLNWLWVAPSGVETLQRNVSTSVSGLMGAIVAGLLLLPVLSGSAQSLTNQYTNNPAFARADYREMAARIAAEDQRNAAILLNGPNQWEVFTFYYHGDTPVYPLPQGQPDPALLEPQLAAIAEQHDRLYALFWGDVQRDPQQVIESWLDTHAFKASEEWVGDVRFVVYGLDSTAVSLTPSDAAFALPGGGQIRLTAQSVLPAEMQAGDVLPLTLVWGADRVPQQRFKVFLHLVGEDGRPVAQRDSEPVGGLRPTTTWAIGESITDKYGLLTPIDLPSGHYTLLVGLYDFFDPSARLPLEEGGDALTLARVEVRP